jgi:hypothetical protein
MPSILGRALVASLINNAGADVAKRRVVVLDTSADSSFALPSAAGDLRVLGITLEAIADAASGRVVVQGVTSCLIEGAVTRGHYLRASATPGALEDAGVLVSAAGEPPAGTCALALEAGADGDEIAVQFVGLLGGGGGAGGPATELDADGTTLAVNVIGDGQYLKRVGATIVSDAGPAAGPATQLDADGTVLAVNAITDGEYLRRVGATVVSGTPAGGGGGGWPSGEYSPLKPPSAPSAYDDEFLGGVLNAAWTQQDSGAGTRVGSVTQRPGWLYQSMTATGGACNTGVWKAFNPAGAPTTVVARGFANVNDNAGCLVRMEIQDTGGALIYGVGKIQGATNNWQVADSSAARTYALTNVTGNVGETWLMLQYEGGANNIGAFVSGDGHVWQRLEGANRSGTIGRIKLVVYSASTARAHVYWDFVRTFPGSVFEVGGVG